MANTELVFSNLKRNFSHTTNIQQQASLTTGKNKVASTTTDTSTIDFSVINRHIQIKDFRKQPKKNSSTSGAIQQNLGMLQHTQNGSNFIFHDISVPFKQLYSLFSYGYIYEHLVGYTSICLARSALNKIFVLQNYPYISEFAKLRVWRDFAPHVTSRLCD